jgi:predicted glycosyltransferase
MKSQQLTELRRQVWDDKFILFQPDTVLQDQLDRFAELIIGDVLDTFARAEKMATRLGQTDKAEAIHEVMDKFKERYDISTTS